MSQDQHAGQGHNIQVGNPLKGGNSSNIWEQPW